ncbi:TlpA family protein disulfide reductase [Bradyrhizobium diazoefficiens]|nr:TlpA disulfide reductase family protein [Bradyrhizobium diazoefficiens]QQN62270.1 TlpA family protein disulfide reductase [Bradyrhizobium diazoefficiens]
MLIRTASASTLANEAIGFWDPAAPLLTSLPNLKKLQGIALMHSLTPKSALSKVLSRRGILAALRGIGASPFLKPWGRAQSQESPPIFRTARYQFTFIRPVEKLRPVILNDLSGRATSLAAMPGKVMLINLWATWCEACRIDLPMLERFHIAVGDRVAVAAISMDRSGHTEVKSYLEKLSIHRLPILLDPDGRLARNSAEPSAQFTAYGLPITYLVDPAGQLEGYIAGAADWLADDAQRLLAYYSST